MRESAAEIKSRIDKAASLDDVGLTPRRMTDIFKQEYGVSPKKYADADAKTDAPNALTDCFLLEKLRRKALEKQKKRKHRVILMITGIKDR